jgi:hypothetical protein
MNLYISLFNNYILTHFIVLIFFTVNAKSNQTNLSNISSPDMNYESPVSFVCNNTLGEGSIVHNIGSYDFYLLLYNFKKTFNLFYNFY